MWVWHDERKCIRKRVRQAHGKKNTNFSGANEEEDKSRWMERGVGTDLWRRWVWVWFGVVRATAPAYAVVCRRRSLLSNQISTIANEVFGGLTALTFLYGAGLWVGWTLLPA